jgi:hypothetical protein
MPNRRLGSVRTLPHGEGAIIFCNDEKEKGVVIDCDALGNEQALLTY